MIDFNVPWNNGCDLNAWLNASREYGWSALCLNVYYSIDNAGIHELRTRLPRAPPSDSGTAPKVVTTLGRITPLGSNVIRRATLVLQEGFQPTSVNKILDSRDYDVVAVMPTTQKTLQAACEVLNCDLINLDYFCHYAQFKVKRGMATSALHRGCYFEVNMATLDHIEGLGDSGNRASKEVAKVFRMQLARVLNYIPLNRLVISPGHTDYRRLVDASTFVGSCDELLSSATGERCSTRVCVTEAPRGCLAKGAARRTYGTGIVINMASEELGTKFNWVQKEPLDKD
ncbi:RNase P subunit p30 family protein [Babesia bovis T2Bo]|uniref:Uncharacterized protein n=1 Tax=Babesia bovis TaxID=5865 RepID=A7AX55_BABBO|nr:RNase P subunit p30 family protein [Babesia bovis T2Bo]EDO05128.1 RNase P subunit p30 family protein [Babesia bovis T2Bo]|eukprot:XP_001608696.1 hypothetical protein [Babesia bovis T2Bo]